MMIPWLRVRRSPSPPTAGGPQKSGGKIIKPILSAPTERRSTGAAPCSSAAAEPAMSPPNRMAAPKARVNASTRISVKSSSWLCGKQCGDGPVLDGQVRLHDPQHVVGRHRLEPLARLQKVPPVTRHRLCVTKLRCQRGVGAQRPDQVSLQLVSDPQ